MSVANVIGNLGIEKSRPGVNRYWIQVASRLDLQFGGIASSLPPLCESTEETGKYGTAIVGFCGPSENTDHLERSSLPFLRLPRGRMRWTSDGVLRRQLAAMIKDADGVHIHGIWDEHSALTGSLAYQLKKPYIVSAHGMLEPWALHKKRLKKMVYSTVFERETLKRATCLRALTRQEVDDYRRFGISGPVAVIPNGVNVPDQISPKVFLDAFPTLADKKLVLFLGRLHQKKGLWMLCRAWSHIAKKFPEAHLVLAGPDFDGTQAQLEQLISSLGIQGSVSLTGMLKSDLKWSALAASTLFVLPSYSEGFSVAVLEALGAGRPVIISRQCNFPEVGSLECGWVIEPKETELQATLERALTLAPKDLAHMAQNGRNLIRRRYSWSAVGSQMRELYDWIQTAKPPKTIEIF